MDRRRTRKYKLNTVAILVVGSLLAVAVVLVGVPTYRGFRATVEKCRHVEEIENFVGQVARYLTSYYRDNGHYPDGLDVSQFKIWGNPQYRDLVDRVEYSTDGKTFELSWKIPARLKERQGERGELHLWEISGSNGKLQVLQRKL
jgi:hypothetical protein